MISVQQDGLTYLDPCQTPGSQKVPQNLTPLRVGLRDRTSNGLRRGPTQPLEVAQLFTVCLRSVPVLRTLSMCTRSGLETPNGSVRFPLSTVIAQIIATLACLSFHKNTPCQNIEIHRLPPSLLSTWLPASIFKDVQTSLMRNSGIPISPLLHSLASASLAH